MQTPKSTLYTFASECPPGSYAGCVCNDPATGSHWLYSEAAKVYGSKGNMGNANLYQDLYDQGFRYFGRQQTFGVFEIKPNREVVSF